MVHWAIKVGLTLFLAVFSFAGFAQDQHQWALHQLSKRQIVHINDYDSAIAISDSIISILEKEKDTCSLVIAKAQHAEFSSNVGEYSSALETVIEALNLHVSGLCDQEDLLYVYKCFGAIYDGLKDMRKLDSTARLGISLWQDSFEDSLSISGLYFQRGVAQTDLVEINKYYDSALLFSTDLNRNTLQLNIWNNMGYVYAEEGDFETAKIYFKRCLIPSLRAKDYKILSGLYNNLAGLSVPGQTQLNYIDSALHYAELTGVLSDIQLFNENKGYALYQVGQYRKAYDVLYLASVLKDSLLNIQKIKAVEELNKKYQSEKQANEIQRLRSEQLANEVKQLQLERNLIALIVGLISILVLAVFFAYSFINTRRIKNKLAKKNVELDHERSVSDKLLLNILPSEVARELKEKGKSDARLYSNVTVMFTDFVSFTKIGESLSPTELVDEVNKHFTYFDEVMEKFGLEKIKTIGDAYLAVCGLPDETPDHAMRVIEAAKEIVEFTNKEDSMFGVRVGINSGPVVAGIVGVKKYAYDIWGDTVNTAARLEAHSEPGKINISASTHMLISDSVTCSYRGKIDAKNKGMIDMYFVE